VSGISVARWDASGIDPDAGGRGLVLSTCWPLDAKFSGPLRYLVHAEMADGNETSGKLSELPLPAELGLARVRPREIGRSRINPTSDGER
jgi:hypothetical protein